MQKKISKTYKKVKTQLREYFLNILDITKKPEMSILPGQLAFTILLSTVPIITFILFAAKSVPNDELLHWACDQQEENQC